MRAGALMVGEILYLVTYRCPRCGIDLETSQGPAGTWLLCPGCGRASLPPTQEQLAAESMPTRAVVDPETLYIGPLFDVPSPPQSPWDDGSRVPLAPSSYGINTQRVTLMVLFLVALGAISDAVISRTASTGLVGFMILGVALLWMVVGGIRL